MLITLVNSVVARCSALGLHSFSNPQRAESERPPKLHCFFASPEWHGTML